MDQGNKVGSQGLSTRFMELPRGLEGWAPARAGSGFQGEPNPRLSRKCSQRCVLGPRQLGLGTGGNQPPCCPVGGPSIFQSGTTPQPHSALPGVPRRDSERGAVLSGGICLTRAERGERDAEQPRLERGQGQVRGAQTDPLPAARRPGLLPEVGAAAAAAFVVVGDGQPGRVAAARDSQRSVLRGGVRVLLPPGWAHGDRHGLSHLCHRGHCGAYHADLLRGPPGEGWERGSERERREPGEEG